MASPAFLTMEGHLSDGYPTIFVHQQLDIFARQQLNIFAHKISYILATSNVGIELLKEQSSSNKFEIYMVFRTNLQHIDLAFNVNLLSCSLFPQMLQISNSSHFKSWSHTPH